MVISSVDATLLLMPLVTAFVQFSVVELFMLAVCLFVLLGCFLFYFVPTVTHPFGYFFSLPIMSKCKECSIAYAFAALRASLKLADSKRSTAQKP